MITKTVTYEDFNGDTRTEELYFNLNEHEINNLQLSPKYKDCKYETTEGDEAEPVKYIGLIAYLQAMMDLEDYGALYAFMAELVLYSYGVKSDDGRSFRKDDKVRDEFRYSIAFDIILSELMSDADKSAAFINGLIDKRLMSKVFPNGIPDLNTKGIDVKA